LFSSTQVFNLKFLHTEDHNECLKTKELSDRKRRMLSANGIVRPEMNRRTSAGEFNFATAVRPEAYVGQGPVVATALLQRTNV
jgi:hypothetical protein